MAVQPWELAPETTVQRRPHLELVPAPPRGGRVVPALVFVALVVGALGYPALRAATAEGPARVPWSPRPASLALVEYLDPVAAFSGDRPMSREPLGGILFVRCTNIWTALPDGSHARKLLEFPGISTATFSPDARTVAFVAPRSGTQRLFMVGADGGGLTDVGPITSGRVSVDAQVTNLVWSPRGDRLFFALVDPAHDPWTGGSTLWMLDGSSGAFNKVGTGWPSPGLVDGHVAYAGWVTRRDENGPSFTSPTHSARYSTKNLSSSNADLLFGATPATLSDSWATQHGAVVLRDDGFGTFELVVKPTAWRKKVVATHAPPPPHSFFDRGRISVAQDSSHAIVDLLDPSGERDLGLLDLKTGEWTVLDYAWSGSASPAPTATGPVRKSRIARLAGDLFEAWGPKGGYSAAALLADDPDELILGGRGGYVVGTPQKVDSGWWVDGTVYRRSEGRFRYQHVTTMFTRTDDHRLEAEATPASKPQRLETVADAKRFLSDVVGDRFKWPSFIPDGAKLNRRWPVDAYSWDGKTTATVHLALPPVDGEKYRRSLNLSFGDVSFSLGCGGENDPEEQPVGDEPGLSDHIGNGPNATRQILWPATMKHRDTGFYSVYGELPKETLLRIAESMS